ncbi:growth arrest and DNA damage-inducible proteins-interacting protein 1-like [Lytechinus variegatus]|uniref:growth arrest and DNA damage-inducible proteins-interacting protein 1-like n=1 Tax=Lytechinus variegatus TaxID=7654 RepID=UPI001BB115F8|nr:growth arrest and DNA damage-inducible proteins-interacting protein 1-like [Lytechinus variegatus]
MATPMAAIRQFLPRTFERLTVLPALGIRHGESNVPRRMCGVTQLPCRQYSDKVLEGMGEFVEEEEQLDLDLLDQPAVRTRPIDRPWEKTRRWHAKQYARMGKASGVDPAIMWPTKSELSKLIEEEKEYFPSLQEMQTELAAEKQAADLERLKREKLIAANMAKMPKMIEDYWKQVEEERAKRREQKEKRNRLLALAKEKLGYAVDPRSPRFKQMVEEMEAEEKKRRKELKKKGIKI